MKINYLFKTPPNSGKAGIVNSALRFSKNLEKNGIKVSINGSGYDYDIIHIHMPFPDYLYKIKKAKSKGVKIVNHAHTNIEDLKGSFPLTENKHVLEIVKRYAMYFFNQGDLVLTPSEWSKKTLIKGGVKVPIEVISNGVDLKKFKYSKERRDRFRKEYDLGRKDIVVYSVGLVFLRKGIDTFVSIAKKMPDINFFWAGKRIKTVVRRTNKILENIPPNCKFLGFVKDIVDTHSGSDIFCFPSYVETQGMVILEAAACKKPVVVRDIPVYQDWLFNKKNCLKSKNTNDFIKNIRLIIENKKNTQKLVKNGRELAVKNDLRKMTKILIKYYENLLNS